MFSPLSESFLQLLALWEHSCGTESAQQQHRTTAKTHETTVDEWTWGSSRWLLYQTKIRTPLFELGNGFWNKTGGVHL